MTSSLSIVSVINETETNNVIQYQKPMGNNITTIRGGNNVTEVGAATSAAAGGVVGAPAGALEVARFLLPFD